jgi:DNA mismatch repair ATPase MutS
MLANLIDSTIEFEKSREENRLVIKEGINEELDELKMTYSELDNFLVIFFLRQRFLNDI